MDDIGRNKPLDFAQRTMKNLEFIHNARQSGHDVHEVTQLMNSMLGLIVFVREADRNTKEDLPDPDSLLDGDWKLETVEGLSILVKQWDETKPKTLGQLLIFLRHAIAHRNLKFSSDSRSWDDVVVTFWNYPWGSTSPNWVVAMHARHLKEFCDRIIDRID